jgi:periplasmic divalent cation tolerance protein
MSQELIVFVTAPTNDEAVRIADSLVSEGLAACVNIVGGIESIYRWEGEVARDRETLLIIKTIDERYAELERRVKELHTYTTPEVIACKVERGSDAYLGWLRESTAGGGAQDS